MASALEEELHALAESSGFVLPLGAAARLAAFVREREKEAHNAAIVACLVVVCSKVKG